MSANVKLVSNLLTHSKFARRGDLLPDVQGFADLDSAQIWRVSSSMSAEIADRSVRLTNSPA